MNLPITTIAGNRGTATLEPGREGGTVIVIRRGWPVAAETIGAVPLRDLHLLRYVVDAASAQSIAESVY